MKLLRCTPETQKFLKELCRNILGEFIGTFVLVSFLVGVGCQTTLSSKNAGGPISGALATGMAVMMGVRLSIEVSGAAYLIIFIGCIQGGHLNPCVSTSLACVGRFPWKKVPFYIATQFIASFLGAAVGYYVYYDAMQTYNGGAYKTLDVASIFTSYPQPFISLVNGFLDSAFGSACLVLPMLAIGDTKNYGTPTKYSPIFYGLLVATICLTFSYNAGGAINPARDFGPRFFLYIVGWDFNVFNGPSYAWWWVPLVAPLVGGYVGAIIYTGVIRIHQESDEDTENKVEGTAGSSSTNTDQPLAMAANGIF